MCLYTDIIRNICSCLYETFLFFSFLYLTLHPNHTYPSNFLFYLLFFPPSLTKSSPITHLRKKPTFRKLSFLEIKLSNHDFLKRTLLWVFEMESKEIKENQLFLSLNLENYLVDWRIYTTTMSHHDLSTSTLSSLRAMTSRGAYVDKNGVRWVHNPVSFTNTILHAFFLN